MYHLNDALYLRKYVAARNIQAQNDAIGGTFLVFDVSRQLKSEVMSKYY